MFSSISTREEKDEKKNVLNKTLDEHGIFLRGSVDQFEIFYGANTCLYLKNHELPEALHSDVLVPPINLSSQRLEQNKEYHGQNNRNKKTRTEEKAREQY